MQIYLYAKSGHTIGLEQTKQCSAIAHYLEDFTPILCTSDFRAGAFAKELLGVKKYVNIDVIRNLHNIMNRKDILLFNSDEANEEMIKEMKNFCSLVYNLQDFKNPVVDKKIYKKTQNPKYEKTMFFGDDDYYNKFMGIIENTKKYDINFLMGHYFFLGNEKIFLNHFTNVIDEEEYTDTIVNSKYLLTSSMQTAFESIASGNNPVLLLREDKSYDEDLISSINIPTINETNLDDIINSFEEIIQEYPKLEEIEFEDFENIKIEISEKIEQFKKLTEL